MHSDASATEVQVMDGTMGTTRKPGNLRNESQSDEARRKLDFCCSERLVGRDVTSDLEHRSGIVAFTNDRARQFICEAPTKARLEKELRDKNIPLSSVYVRFGLRPMKSA